MTTITEHLGAAYLVESTGGERLDVFGPVIELLTSLAGEAHDPCIMRGTIAPGGIVPLHSHADPEIFVQQSGTLEGLSQSANGSRWLPIRPGGVFYVPGGARHSFRNLAREPAVSLIISTVRMGHFFARIGVAISGTRAPEPITSERLQHFLKVSNEFGYWNGSPADNAAVGLNVPLPTT
jgi:quercetin dioxygenase-like cupin family protein